MFPSRHPVMQRFLVALVLGGWPGLAWGLDSGLPYARGDVEARVTVEVVFDRLDRSITQEIAFGDDRFEADQEERRLITRVSFFPFERVTIHLQAGASDAREAVDSAVPLFGGGATIRLWEQGRFFLNGFLGGYYVDEIEYTRPGVLTPLAEFSAVQRLEHYLEYGGGLQLAGDLLRRPGLRVTPYGGVVASRMDAEGEERFVLTTVDRRRRDDHVDFEEDGAFSLVAGLAVQRHANFGARVEGRFLDQSSYTAGIFFSF